MQTLLLAHAAVAWILVGLIWTIQVVHYPLFRHVDPDRFQRFHAGHARRVTILVAVLMPAEALLATLLAVRLATPACWIGLGLVALVWLATATLQVPLHARLAEGKDEAVLRRLVATNWIRTIAWSLRGAIALHLLL